MKYEIDGRLYNLVIERKNNKNTYLKVKEDLTIHITTNKYTSMNFIYKLLDDKYIYLKKAIDKMKIRKEKEDNFYLLGKKYDIVIYPSINQIYKSNNKIYISDMKSFEKWLKNETLRLYKDHLDKIYKMFEEDIPYPKLKIRNMKTRWGVNNKRDNSVTLNGKLIRFDLTKLDYVIVHELAHFIHFDHSKAFWSVVEKYNPDYKRIRKEMRK